MELNSMSCFIIPKEVLPISLSELPNSCQVLSKKEAINLLITSIAIEESTLSHILEIESEKVSYAMNQLKHGSRRDMEKILKINRSMEDIIEKILDMQIILKNKLKTVLCINENEQEYEKDCCEDNETYFCEKCNSYHQKTHQHNSDLSGGI